MPEPAARPDLQARRARLLHRVLRPVVAPLQAFFATEAAGGVVLLACAAAAIVAAAALGHDRWSALFELPVTVGVGSATARFSLHALVNDGLMTLFFFVVGMEIKRELAHGELASFGRALLPALAALGGMALPAGIYAVLNASGPGAHGWGIPVATDIAFCVGLLTLLRSRVPRGLLVFITALAIFDDIGGILVIAVFYGGRLSGPWLGAAAVITAALVLMGRRGVASPWAWLALSAALWGALHAGGVHATIAGVVAGLAVPAQPRADGDRAEDVRSVLDGFEAALHPWVAYGVMPLFALANAGVDVSALGISALARPVAAGVALGLVVGKTVGIFLFTRVAVAVRLAPAPGGAGATKLLGTSAAAGIGFTVALFIAGLAFPDEPELLDEAKLGILAGSLVAGLLGSAILRFTPTLAHPGGPGLGGSPDRGAGSPSPGA